MINDLLFAYGSLLNTAGEFGIYLNNNAVLVCTAKFNGRLYDLGEYPGAIASEQNDQYVSGSIYQLNDPEKAFPVLDAYEGYGANEEHPNLFIRRLVTAATENGIVRCWMYLYNRPVTGFFEITSGDYAAYLTSKKR